MACQLSPFSLGSGWRSFTVRQMTSNDSRLSVFCLGVSCAKACVETETAKASRRADRERDTSHRQHSMRARYYVVMNWENSEDIAIALMEAHPGVDPLTVRFTDLRQWIIALPEFEGDPAKS